MKTTAIFSVIMLAAGFSTLLRAESALVGGGVIDVFDKRSRPILQLGYTADPLVPYFGLEPTANLLVSEQSTRYFSAGLQKTLLLSDRCNWGLGLEAGYYHTNANDLDLDYDLIFRSRAFVDYKITTSSLVRLELAHLSNARLGNDNPGTETLAVNWVINLPGK